MNQHNLKQILFKLGQKVPDSVLRYLQNKYIYEPRIKRLGIDSNTTPLFDSIFFEVRTKCNGDCSFCAASRQNEIRQDTTMPMDLYIKVINELKEIKFAGRVAYHINNDPLIFPHLTEYVEYARRSLPSAWIQILTNGKALSINKGKTLLSIGINELSINYYNDDFNTELPKSITHIRNHIIPSFYKEEQIKSGYGPDGENRNIFKFNVNRRKVNEIRGSRAGTSPNKKGKSKIPRSFCEYPFTRFYLTTDGKVSKCCADLYFSDPMGNVNEDSVINIWKNKKYNMVRQFLLKGNREAVETCSKCDFYGVTEYSDSNIVKFLLLISACY